MLLRKLNDPAKAQRLGMSSLLLFFLLWRWYLRPESTFLQGFIDGFASVALVFAMVCIVAAGRMKRRC